MNTTTQPMTEGDLAKFVNIELEAFRQHPRTPMVWPRGYTQDLYAYFNRCKVDSYNEPNEQFIKVVDETGDMIAASEWIFNLDVDAEAKGLSPSPNEPPPSDWPTEGNWSYKLASKIKWAKWQRDLFADRPYIELSLLITDPLFHGRGAGTKLVSWGCEQADKLTVPMCLTSTPAGLKLYERFGFRIVTVMRTDMKQFGWGEPYDEDAATQFWMVREPRPSS